MTVLIVPSLLRYRVFGFTEQLEGSALYLSPKVHNRNIVAYNSLLLNKFAVKVKYVFLRWAYEHLYLLWNCYVYLRR